MKYALLLILLSLLPGLKAGDQEDTTHSYQRGESINVAPPRPFRQQDIGKAYVRTVTGLNGVPTAPNRVTTRRDTSFQTLFFRYTNGLMLNAWGTGMGMHSGGIDAKSDVRRAKLVVMKIVRSDRLDPTIPTPDLKDPEHPLLLAAIDYGYSYNLSISGPKSRFTNAVFQELQTAIRQGDNIRSIAKRYALELTTSYRGIRSKTADWKIPVNAEQLRDYYELDTVMPVYGQYTFLADLEAHRIIWEE